MKLLFFTATIAWLVAFLFSQERRRVALLYAAHEQVRCWPPHCDVHWGDKWPDGQRRAKSRPGRLWERLLGAPDGSHYQGLRPDGCSRGTVVYRGRQ